MSGAGRRLDATRLNMQRTQPRVAVVQKNQRSGHSTAVTPGCDWEAERPTRNLHGDASQLQEALINRQEYIEFSE